jgi:2-polyprenyl-3-methyl-5-hydroxy-6-metoxy-1,4-benzoquinol methylase
VGIALGSADQLSRIAIGKNKLNFILKIPNSLTRFMPSNFPIKSMLSHVGQYRFACSHICNSKVLDIACGTGYGSELLRRNGNTVIGIDINQKNVDFARKNFPDNSYEVGNAEDLSRFTSGSFDAIVSIQTIEHFSRPKKAIAEFYRLLKKDAILIGAVPINCHHSLDDNQEAKEEYFFADCKDVVTSSFDKVSWYFNDLKTNMVCAADEKFLEGIKSHRGDFVFIAQK